MRIMLAVSRAVGDLQHARCGVANTPTVQQLPVRSGDVIVLASDGVWNFADEDDVARLALREDAAARILQLALDRASNDNITVAVIRVD
jgi:serine/threonine protein phosphatase PrpC